VANLLKARPIAFFGHEHGDARLRKRIAAFQAQGREVIGFTFHRQRDKPDLPLTWQNIHLGVTYNRRYLLRLTVFLKSLVVLWQNRELLGRCGVIYAINTDNTLLAFVGRFFAGSAAPVVIELADIQPIMTARGLLAKILRALERVVLGKCRCLVTTSPGFVKNYFLPLQNYRGEIFLLENKVYPSHELPAAVVGFRAPQHAGRPWVIGCFGALRCRSSLEWMHALALELGDRVQFILRGYPAGTLAPEFAKLLGNLPNFHFAGPYQYPAELAEMYGKIDINWAFDMSDTAGNSAWLLPNRIYEGGCFAVPVIAAKNTETGRWIEQNSLGWCFEEPLLENLGKFLPALSPAEWQHTRERCASQPRRNFVGDADVQKLAEKFVEWEQRSGGSQ
jgi:succinoglycan biosynthesis protein ExoL